MYRLFSLLIVLVLLIGIGTAHAQDGVILPVIHMSQYSATATAWGDCGGCVMAMIARYYSISTTCDYWHYEVFGGAAQGLPPANVDTMAILARARGVPVRPMWHVDQVRIAKEIRNGNPVGVMIRPYRNHMILVYGITASGDFLVHDPGNVYRVMSAQALADQLQRNDGWVWLTGAT